MLKLLGENPYKSFATEGTKKTFILAKTKPKIFLISANLQPWIKMIPSP